MKTSSYIMFFVFHLLASISYQLANLLNLSYVALFSLVTCVSSRTLLIEAHLVWVKNAMASTCWKIAIQSLLLFQLLFLLIKLSHIYGTWGWGILPKPSWIYWSQKMYRFVIQIKISFVIFVLLPNRKDCLLMKVYIFLRIVLIWFIVICGVHFLYLPLILANISSL